MAKKQVKTETTAEAYLVEVIDPILEEIKNDISQTRADQKTIANTLTMHKDSLQESFEAMKQQKAQGKIRTSSKRGHDKCRQRRGRGYCAEPYSRI